MSVPILRIQMGCDPEVFITKGGKIVPSHEIVPASGYLDSSGGKIVRDGIQVELNPKNTHCNNILLHKIRSNILALGRLAAGFKISPKSQVTVDKATFDKVPSDSKAFGCKPSFDIYSEGEIKRDIDSQTYRKRSAAGHIHLGFTKTPSNSDEAAVRAALDNPLVTVKVLDIICGNTLVLLDRDPSSKRRREVYGRAGEFRTPDYGIEYRVPSNFWLRHPVLASLTFKLARTSVLVAACPDATKELMALVDQKDIIAAINNNDAKLARKNFNKIKPFLQGNTLETPRGTGFDSKGFWVLKDKVEMAAFEKLVKDGIDAHFGPDMIENWHKCQYGHGFNDWAKKQ